MAATIEPVGIIEIAARLGVQRSTVDKWQTRGLLPKPRWQVGGRPAWAWSDIAHWATTTGRMPTNVATYVEAQSCWYA